MEIAYIIFCVHSVYVFLQLRFLVFQIPNILRTDQNAIPLFGGKVN